MAPQMAQRLPEHTITGDRTAVTIRILHATEIALMRID
jgi:hypothetical protein